MKHYTCSRISFLAVCIAIAQASSSNAWEDSEENKAFSNTVSEIFYTSESLKNCGNPKIADELLSMFRVAAENFIQEGVVVSTDVAEMMKVYEADAGAEFQDKSFHLPPVICESTEVQARNYLELFSQYGESTHNN